MKRLAAVAVVLLSASVAQAQSFWIQGPGNQQTFGSFNGTSGWAMNSRTLQMQQFWVQPSYSPVYQPYPAYYAPRYSPSYFYAAPYAPRYRYGW
jgi:hypothetical protein